MKDAMAIATPTQPIYTTSNGAPVADPERSLRIGQSGPLLLQDFNLIDLLAHFDRERIPERVVHAKGAGAYGEFEVTEDISDICSADFLSEVGKKTTVFTRFSTVGGEKGSPDAARDPRGMSIKFYTQEGNLDWSFNNTPVFFIRDPTLFPLLIHTQKRNPKTNLKDADMFWDYFNTHQESIHQVMILFSDRGTPASYRHMHSYSGHTYKMVASDGSFKYIQIHVKSNQGIKNMSLDEASAASPDHHTKDLSDAIERGDYPSWSVSVQVMDPADAAKYRWNIFDLTKTWPQADYPLREFGRLTLNRNPENYFAEVEQSAFAPAHTVPGLQPSADPVLQARLFSYPDSQRHRLGTNYQQIPVNKPLHAFSPYQRDGPQNVNGNLGSTPNYPSSFRPPRFAAQRRDLDDSVRAHESWVGEAMQVKYEVVDDDFVQPRMLWQAVLAKEEGQQQALVYNVASHLRDARIEVRRATYRMFARVDEELGRRLEKETEERVEKV